jgi:hypothetical protein
MDCATYKPTKETKDMRHARARCLGAGTSRSAWRGPTGEQWQWGRLKVKKRNQKMHARWLSISIIYYLYIVYTQPVFGVFLVAFSAPLPPPGRDTSKHATRYIRSKQIKGPLLFFLKDKKKAGRLLSVVGLRFFCRFCQNLLRVILTPPGRYQHPHDTNNPPVASRSLGQL